MSIRRRIYALLPEAFLLLFFALQVGANIFSAGPVFDEPVHLLSGYSSLRWRDFRLNAEHPPLIKELAALPFFMGGVWPARVEPPVAEGTAKETALFRTLWNGSISDRNLQWEAGRQFLFARNDAWLTRINQLPPGISATELHTPRSAFINDADSILHRSRLAVASLGILLGILIYCWARQVCGRAAAIVALLMYCSDPSFTANSGLVATDVAASTFIFGSVYFFWRTSRRVTASNLIALSLFTLCALTSKFSGLILMPIFAALALFMVLQAYFRESRADNRDRGLRAITTLAVLVGVALSATLGIWGCYGFRYSAVPGSSTAVLPLESLLHETAGAVALREAWPVENESPPLGAIREAARLSDLSLTSRTLLWIDHARLLPEAYVYGFAITQRESVFRDAFLRGRFSNRGFRLFFLWTLLLKTPLPILIALVAGVVILPSRESLRGEVMLWIPVVIYGVTLSRSALNIGHRHSLPMYPFLYVLAGGAIMSFLAQGDRWRNRGWRAAMTTAAVLVMVSPLVVFSPPFQPRWMIGRQLGYANELAGGPLNVHRYLVDSSVDWGQDLPALSAWVHQRPSSQPVNLSYFGTAEPAYYGIRYVDPVTRDGLSGAHIPGYFAISATNFEGARLPARIRGFWKDATRQMEYMGRAGNSILIFRSPKPIVIQPLKGG